MKRLLWFGLLAVLPVSSALGEVQSTGQKQPIGVKQPIDNSQNGPFGMYYMPKWYMYAMVAANCYQTGMSYLTSDPKMAVKAFELGLLYARKAEAIGGGESAENISVALSKELKIAEANLAKAGSKDSGDNNKSNDLAKNDTGNGNDLNQEPPRNTVPKNNHMTIQTGGSFGHMGGSPNNGITRPRAGM